MIAYLVLLLAAFSRFVPHAMHGVGVNFTAVGAGLLFFGARRPRWQAAVAVAVMAVSDVLLTTQVYGMKFYASHYLMTWTWYALVCLMGSALLRRVTAMRVAAAVLCSATGFFLWSNFAVWAGSQVTYAHTFGGLMQCYAAGLPFYRNDLISTGLFAVALFALPVLAARMVEMMQGQRTANS